MDHAFPHELAPLTVICPKIKTPVLDGRAHAEKWAEAARLDHLVREVRI